jgi:hypothetical protein
MGAGDAVSRDRTMDKCAKASLRVLGPHTGPQFTEHAVHPLALLRQLAERAFAQDPLGSVPVPLAPRAAAPPQLNQLHRLPQLRNIAAAADK